MNWKWFVHWLCEQITKSAHSLPGLHSPHFWTRSTDIILFSGQITSSMVLIKVILEIVSMLRCIPHINQTALWKFCDSLKLKMIEQVYPRSETSFQNNVGSSSVEELMALSSDLSCQIAGSHVLCNKLSQNPSRKAHLSPFCIPLVFGTAVPWTVDPVLCGLNCWSIFIPSVHCRCQNNPQGMLEVCCGFVTVCEE